MCQAREVTDVDRRLVCVYCGSSSGVGAEFTSEAARLGGAIAAAGLGLVYGGGRVGLMGLVADSVLEAGAPVVGVIPESLVLAETGHNGLDRLEIVGSMHERKARMADLAGGFVVLPGGFGTLDETFEVLTWNQLGLVTKPVVFLDGTGFWKPVRDLIDHLIGSGFVNERFRSLVTFAASPEEAVAIASGPAPEVPGKLSSLDVTAKREMR